MYRIVIQNNPISNVLSDAIEKKEHETLDGALNELRWAYWHLFDEYGGRITKWKNDNELHFDTAYAEIVDDSIEE